MDKLLNSKKEKDSIYEIYRACRLCGGGAGYKMPIIQSIVELDGTDVELKQKIRECVQIEVTQDDKMPPLICELCVDKVNDFYEFLDMCRQINTRTRLRLGLPPQALARGASDAGDCILGLTEPVFVEDSDAEENTRNKKAASKTKGKKDSIVKVKVEDLQERRSSLSKKRDPTPPRTTRNRSREDDLPLKNLKKENAVEERSTRQKKREITPPRVTRNSSRDDDMPLNNLKHSPKPLKAAPKSILKKESIYKKEEEREERSSRQKKREITPPRVTRNSSRDDDMPLNNFKSDEKSRSKRLVEKDDVKTEIAPKKVKILLKPITSESKKPSSGASYKSSKPSPGPKSKTRPTRASDSEKKPSPVKRDPSPPSPIVESVCEVCGQGFKSPQGRINHYRVHTVGYTDPKLACNPCGEWFCTQKEMSAHHQFHTTTPYSCENCYSDFKTLTGFDDHLKNNECIPMYVAPDVKCDVCWHLFPTYTALYAHHCPGEEQRPGGKCNRCERSYVLYKNLVKHESTCTARKKGELIVDQSVLDQLKPVQIRLERCDHLVRKKERYDMSEESCNYGSDQRYHPYRSQCRLKAGFRGMVKIHDEIKKAFCSQGYVDWDSAESNGSDDEKFDLTTNTVHSLVALTLKTIFSQRLIGKLPRKKRRVKIDKVFDSLQAEDENLQVDISNIINKLCAEDDDDILTGKNDDKLVLSSDVSDKFDDKNNVRDNSNDNDITNDSAKSSNDNDKEVNDSSLKKTEESNDNLDSLAVVNDKKNLSNDSISENDLQSTNVNDELLNNDSKKSPLKSKHNSTTDNYKDRSELNDNDIDEPIIKNNVNDSISAKDNDKISDILTKTVESKTSLGINEFSFDTV